MYFFIFIQKILDIYLRFFLKRYCQILREKILNIESPLYKFCLNKKSKILA
jgi:hypothetical protein